MAVPPTILLVDDDVDFLMMNSALLEGEGYRVLTAYGSDEALRTAREERPDLMILDVMMSEVTEGFDLSRTLRQDPGLSGVPIILLTAVNRHFRPLVFGPSQDWIPVDLLLDKPVAPGRLVEEVRRILEIPEKQTP